MAPVLTAHVPHTILLTCVEDGRCHQVADELMAAGLRARTGRYRAVCGHTVTATAMLVPGGRPCPDCAVAAAPPNPGGYPRRSGRHRRPGLLRRLLAPASDSLVWERTGTLTDTAVALLELPAPGHPGAPALIRAPASSLLELYAL